MLTSQRCHSLFCSVPTPIAGTPTTSPPVTPSLAASSLPLSSSTTASAPVAVVPAGPSQLLTALLTRLPDATNRTLIDQAAVDFAFLNSKAARKRLVKVSTVFHL